MKLNIFVIILCIALVCSAEYPQSSEISKRADLPDYEWKELVNTDTLKVTDSINTYDIGIGVNEMISKITVYADTIVVGNPNTVIIWGK